MKKVVSSFVFVIAVMVAGQSFASQELLARRSSGAKNHPKPSVQTTNPAYNTSPSVETIEQFLAPSMELARKKACRRCPAIS